MTLAWSSSRLPSRVVVGGYSRDASGDGPEAGTGLRVLDLVADAPEGALVAYATVGREALPSPTWVARHPHRPWLISVGEASPSELVCTRLEDDGALTVLGRVATGGDSGCHLALVDEGRWVVVAHYGSGTVGSFALHDDGRVTGPHGWHLTTAPAGPDRERQAGPHAHQVVADPGRPGELLVPDLGTDRVHRLRLADDGDVVEAAAPVVLPPGFGPRHLVVAGDVLVVVGELSAQLWLARRNGGGWRPTQVLPTTSRPALDPGQPGMQDTRPQPSGLRLAGDLVVVAVRGVDRLATFRLDRATGTLTPVGEVSCAGRNPRDLAVHDGRVWVANQDSDEVVVLDLDAVADGRDEPPLVRMAVPRPACVVLIDDRPADRGPGR